jgi:pimeloyl-ACP methyl ester carboxylesterase
MCSFSSISEVLNQSAQAIIRPPRANYNLYSISQGVMTFGGAKCQRTAVQLKNPRGLTLQCSLYKPMSGNLSQIPCVVYCHGNASCQLEALTICDLLIPLNIAVVGFDFAGCGKSDGETISLGYYEQDDIRTVLKYLSSRSDISKVGLWGRSMGAVSSILTAARPAMKEDGKQSASRSSVSVSTSSSTSAVSDPSTSEDPATAAAATLPIVVLILDSPFSSLYYECLDVGSMGMPSIAVRMGLPFLRRSIRNKAGFDIYDVDPLSQCRKLKIPAFFLHAHDDEVVLPKHTEWLHQKWGGEKTRMLIDGDHNTPRPKEALDAICDFLVSYLH